MQASTITPGTAQQLSELKLPAKGSAAASLLVHTVHAFCTIAAGGCGRWVDAERHAQRSLDALQTVPPGDLRPAELRWREVCVRHNALLARLQQVGDAGSELPEVKQRAREQLRLLQEHCRDGVAAGVDPAAAPAESVDGLKRCASLLRLAAAVGKLCLQVLGRCAPSSPVVRSPQPPLRWHSLTACLSRARTQGRCAASAAASGRMRARGPSDGALWQPTGAQATSARRARTRSGARAQALGRGLPEARRSWDQ